MSPEETFRRVLAARLPAGPAWAAWIDGTAAELSASVPPQTPEQGDRLSGTTRDAQDRTAPAPVPPQGIDRNGLAHEFAAVLHEYRTRNYGPENPLVEVALADLALDLLQPGEAS